MTTTTRTLKRIEPFQLGKMLGALYGLMGLLFIPFIFLFSAFGAAASQNNNGMIHSPMAGAAFGAGVGIGVAILMVFGYAIMGFVVGLIGACLYNILAKFVGGIQVEVE